MPLVTISADEGRTIEQKRGLVKDITEAVIIQIVEGKKENRAKGGKLAID
jgi:4-oxalocrotonate tautomerase